VQQANEIIALEQARDARIATIEADNGRERDEAKQRVAELEDGLASARQEARALADTKRADDEAHDARIAAVQKRLLDVQSARDDLEQKLAAANARRESDQRSLERAKDAMAVALGQIEETHS
jgi:hypothetical protein